MVPQPQLSFLLGDDLGAGKTIMAGSDINSYLTSLTRRKEVMGKWIKFYNAYGDTLRLDYNTPTEHEEGLHKLVT